MKSLNLFKMLVSCQKYLLAVSISVTLLLVLTIIQDFAETIFKGTAFYLSESLLFSTLWLLFIPLLYVQRRLMAHHIFRTIVARSLLFIILVVFHLLLFPALVWALSGLLMEHRFAYVQTTQYILAEYLYILLLFYAIPVLLTYYVERTRSDVSAVTLSSMESPVFETHLLVPDGHRKLRVAVTDINFINASSPYVFIHTAGKKYLIQDTLRSLEKRLSPQLFVRVHKSTLVNLQELSSFTSRQNGDYDLTLKDGSCLRLSRNYTANFKAALAKQHQVGI